MMLGVHGGEKVGGGFVLGFGLSAAPMHEQAVAEAPEHSHHPHGMGQAHPALIVQVGDIQALVESAFDAPGGAVIFEPLGGIEFRRRQAGHQRDGFGAMVAQVSAQERHLLDAGKVHLFGGGGGGAQGARFKLAFVELPTARQGRRRVLREKKWQGEQRRVFRSGL